MSSKLITVIIPTYNRAKRLGAAIESVRNQTYSDWELVIVDDGSTDGTAAMVRLIDDSRVRYIYQNNRGVAAARNVGLAHAGGNLIAFLDSDDLWEPRKLEVQAEFMFEHPEVAICQAGEIWIRNGRRVNPKLKHAKPSGWIFKESLKLCLVSPSAVMLRRSVFDCVGNFDESLPACEDYDLWLRASLHYDIVTLPYALTIKVGGHDDQLSKQWGLDCYRIASLEKLLVNPALAPVHRGLVEDEIISRVRIVAAGAKKRGNEEMFQRYSGKVFDDMQTQEMLLDKTKL